MFFLPTCETVFLDCDIPSRRGFDFSFEPGAVVAIGAAVNTQSLIGSLAAQRYSAATRAGFAGQLGATQVVGLGLVIVDAGSLYEENLYFELASGNPNADFEAAARTAAESLGGGAVGGRCTAVPGFGALASPTCYPAGVGATGFLYDSSRAFGAVAYDVLAGNGLDATPFEDNPFFDFGGDLFDFFTGADRAG